MHYFFRSQLRVSLTVALSFAFSARATAGDYAVIVNKDNPVDSLSKAAVARIFKAEEQFWKGTGRIQVLLPKAGSHEKKMLLDKVYKMTDDELKRYWTELVFCNRISEPPGVLPSSVVTVNVVVKSKGAIALVDSATIGKDANVKVLQIDGKRPGAPGYLFHEPERSGVLTTSDEVAVKPAAAPRSNQDSNLEKRIAELEQTVTDLVVGGDQPSEEGLFDQGPLFKLRGFGDVRFGVEHVDPETGDSTTSDSFVLGQLDLFITSQLSDRISFLNETVFEASDENETIVDVERLILKYSFSDHLNVQVGRFHTTLGYWNETFHHGEWLQTSIGRPQVLNFEDNGGILPVHLTGFVFKGSHDTEPVGVDYTLEVGNGRGPTVDPPQVVNDANDSKAVNVALQVRPSAIEGLRFGANWYLDIVPPNADPTAGPLHGSQDENILGVFGAYKTGSWELVAEYFDIQHDDSSSDANSDAGYLQVARTFGVWTPYVRFDYTDIDDGDTYFSDLDDEETIALGVRWDVATWNAIKLQVSHTEVDAPPAGVDEDSDAVVVQTAFAF